MSSLLHRQMQFSRMVALLILKAEVLGYTVTLGDAYRYPDCPYGHKNSNHKRRLAVDLNVFKDGVYLDKSGQYDDLIDWWVSIGGASGRGFGDDNHFSLLHGEVI